MKGVELYGQVRRAVYVEGLSRREAARRFAIDPRTVAKMLAFSVPPGYRRGRRPARPKLDPLSKGRIKGLLDIRETRGRGAAADRGASDGRVQWKSSVMRCADSMTATYHGSKGRCPQPHAAPGASGTMPQPFRPSVRARG